MQPKKYWFGAGLLFILITLTACGTPAEESGDNRTESMPDNVSCQVFYRATVGAPFDESILTLSTAGDQSANQAAAEFEDMRVEATFLSDAGEGKSLSIAVTDLTAGAELTRALYQFDPQASLHDQFIGGHGFTGLAYVYHPVSDAELQYFCGAGS